MRRVPLVLAALGIAYGLLWRGSAAYWRNSAIHWRRQVIGE